MIPAPLTASLIEGDDLAPVPLCARPCGEDGELEPTAVRIPDDGGVPVRPGDQPHGAGAHGPLQVLGVAHGGVGDADAARVHGVVEPAGASHHAIPSSARDQGGPHIGGERVEAAVHFRVEVDPVDVGVPLAVRDDR